MHTAMHKTGSQQGPIVAQGAVLHILQLPIMENNLKKNICMRVFIHESEVAQSCLTLCDPVDGSQPGSSIHGIFQARILVQVAIFFSRGSSGPRDQTWVSRIVGKATRDVTVFKHGSYTCVRVCVCVCVCMDHFAVHLTQRGCETEKHFHSVPECEWCQLQTHLSHPRGCAGWCVPSCQACAK